MMKFTIHPKQVYFLLALSLQALCVAHAQLTTVIDHVNTPESAAVKEFLEWGLEDPERAKEKVFPEFWQGIDVPKSEVKLNLYYVDVYHIVNQDATGLITTFSKKSNGEYQKSTYYATMLDGTAYLRPPESDVSENNYLTMWFERTLPPPVSAADFKAQFKLLTGKEIDLDQYKKNASQSGKPQENNVITLESRELVTGFGEMLVELLEDQGLSKVGFAEGLLTSSQNVGPITVKQKAGNTYILFIISHSDYRVQPGGTFYLQEGQRNVDDLLDDYVWPDPQAPESLVFHKLTFDADVDVSYDLSIYTPTGTSWAHFYVFELATE